MLALSLGAVRRAQQLDDVAAALQQKILERGILRDEYLLYAEERPRAQWEVNTGQLEVLLRRAAAEFDREDERQALGEMSNLFTRSEALFREVARTAQERATDPERMALTTAFRERLTSTLLLLSYDLYNRAKHLSQAASTRAAKAERRALFLVVAMIVDLSALVRSVAADLAAREDPRQIELVVQDGLKGFLDRNLARTLLQNLLGNAWKFTRDAGRARVEFGAVDEGGARAFFVRDNGAGFDMAYAGKLFAPFQRLHTVYEFPGDGIGLATAERIVRRHGGRIWAEGSVGAGATFYFTLPAGPAAGMA